jgi:PEP-CTERM motif
MIMKIFNAFLYIRPITFVIGSLLTAGRVLAQFSISDGDLYVYQIGNNTVSGTAANPIFIDQLNTSGTLLNQVAVPVSTAGTFGQGLLASGQSATEGSLALSPSDNALTFMGYSGIAVGTTGVNGQSLANANRDVGMVGASGNFSIPATSTTAYGPTTGAGRGAVTDGNGNYWTVGVGTPLGVFYYGNNAAAAQVTTTGSARSIGIYNGYLYYTAGSALYTVSASMSSATPTAIINPGAGTLDGFVFNPSMTICYIANGATGGGIEKWTFNGTSWVLAYTLDTASGFSFVTADFSQANPVLYATTLASGGVDSIDTITDTGSGSTTTTLDTTSETGGDETFNGIVFDPVPEPSILVLAGLGFILCVSSRCFRRRAFTLGNIIR